MASLGHNELIPYLLALYFHVSNRVLLSPSTLILSSFDIGLTLSTYMYLTGHYRLVKKYMKIYFVSNFPTRPIFDAMASMDLDVHKRLLTHWGRVCIYASVNWVIIGSGNGLSPLRHEATTWLNAKIIVNWNPETKFTHILIEIETFPFKKMHLKMSSAKCWQFCLSLIKSPQSGVTLCFQFVSAAATAAMTFASHVKTVSAKP